ASPTSVPAGVVSLKVTNTGYLTHELVVLPLAAGHLPGTRTVGNDGKVDETGSLGEASASCTAGEGDGITSGSSGWVTLHLPAGRPAPPAATTSCQPGPPPTPPACTPNST